MLKYEMEVHCHVGDDSPVEVRAFIDPISADVDDVEQEVALRYEPASSTWRGSFAITWEQAQGVYYRVGVFGHAGGTWTLHIRERGSDHVCLSDGEQLLPPRTWILGTCELDVSETSVQPAPLQRGDDRAQDRGPMAGAMAQPRT